MIVIEGPWWFIGALVVFALHALYLRSWRLERLSHLNEMRARDAADQKRHDEFMSALSWYRRAKLGWSEKRGQA
jgi:hypothetical protein